jgi:hypothetical protein
MIISSKHVKHRIIGTTIVMERGDFHKWLVLDKEVKNGLLSKLFGRKKR